MGFPTETTQEVVVGTYTCLTTKSRSINQTSSDMKKDFSTKRNVDFGIQYSEHNELKETTLEVIVAGTNTCLTTESKSIGQTSSEMKKGSSIKRNVDFGIQYSEHNKLKENTPEVIVAGTNTCPTTESIGQTSSEMKKDSSIKRNIDFGLQFREHDELKEHFKSASLMTSLYGLTHSSQVSTTDARAVQNINSETAPEFIVADTNTCLTTESKSIGLTSSEMEKDSSIKQKVYLESQYSKHNELKEVTTPVRLSEHFKSESLMTSLYGLPQSCQVSTTDATVVRNIINGFVQVSPHCECASVMTLPSYDTASVQTPISMKDIILFNKDLLKIASAQPNRNNETNTEIVNPTNMECITQTSFWRDQTNAEVSVPDLRPFTVPTTMVPTTVNKCQFQKNLNRQLMTLSRLIGNRKTCSHIEKPIITPILSPHIDTDKWIKKCNSMDTGYKRLSDMQPREDFKSTSLFLSSCFKSSYDKDDKKSSPANDILGPDILPATVTLSKDSLADVLPIDPIKIAPSNAPKIHRIMVDKVTSDENVAKDVKESILQACPENRDTETESMVKPSDQKSAGVFTSRCILPTPSPCLHSTNREIRPSDCLFVYGEPRCVVHNQSVNASVQMDPCRNDGLGPNKQEECINYSIGMQLTSCFGQPPPSQRKPAEAIREVLSPNVYKALYATTKYVASDNSMMTIRDTGVGSFNAEFETVLLKTPDQNSANLMTSQYRQSGQSIGCCCKKICKHEDCVLTYLANRLENTTQTSCHAKVLQVDENNGSLDECVKTHLVSSCRYYSSLLSKQIDRVKQNLTKRIPSNERCSYEVPTYTTTDTCTMKPSGRDELACQTCKYKSCYKSPKCMSCCVLSPAVSLTNICRNDQPHLKSVYYTLMAIEGRLRRLKLNVPD